MLTTSTHRIEQRRGRFPTSRVYVWLPETVLENLENRRNRDVKTLRAVALQGLQQHGFSVDLSDLRWSQKAGCGCGCSPGFVLGQRLFNGDEGYVDVHVNVTAEGPGRKELEAARGELVPASERRTQPPIAGYSELVAGMVGA